MKQLPLTWFELYKLFSRKSVWIFFAIMVFCIYLPLQLLTLSSGGYAGYYQSTPPTAQQVQQAKAEMKQIAPKVEGRTANLSTKEITTLNREYVRDTAILNAETGSAIKPNLGMLQQTIDKLKAQGQTGFAYRTDTLEYNMMKRLPYIGFGHYNGASNMIIDFFKTYGLIIFGAMILIGLSPIFSEEYSLGTDSFLLTTKRGRRQLVTAKVLASTLYVLVIEGILMIVNVASNLSLFDIGGFDYPLQSIALYSAPFNLSVGQYIVLAVFIQLLGGIAFGFLIMLLSSFNRSTLVAFFIPAGVFALPEFVVMMFGQKNWAQTLMDFSYTGFIQVSRLFQSFVAYNVFGYPLLYPFLLIGLAILVSIPIVWLINFSYCRHQVT
jgi:ABC-type transport system involved in multi-copper enzyme maturation permease subunit